MTSALACMVVMTRSRNPAGSTMSLHAHALARRLVGVAGADTAPGGAYLALAQASFLHVVQHDVVRHDEVRLAGDLEPASVDVPALQIVDLLAQDGGIDHNAVADDGHDVGVEDAGWHQMEGELAPEVLDGVARVVAPLVA